MSKEIKFLSVPEAAAKLGVTRARVNQLINDGRLPAQRIGRFYAIREDDLKLVKDRPTGRPPKEKAGA